MEEDDKKLEKNSSDGTSTWLLWVIIIISVCVAIFCIWRWPAQIGEGALWFMGQVAEGFADGQL